ncbi:glycosyltransferase family 2 protein [Candidatus Bathyarchaeota archaeon]|nr:glycosyltransferase family 2 protein [Candidatus Bathyarchaeota archaeon]
MTPKEKKVSVFIPVYENSDSLEELLEDLTNDSYENKEIFVMIDKPNEKSLEVAKKYGSKVNFTLNGQRRGKVDVLNSAVKNCEGEILVFLDSDVRLGDSKEFLGVIEREMEGVDILDVKKRIGRDSFIPRMVNYEYISSNFGNYLYSKLIKRCFGINGAAFAIKREAFGEVGGFSKVVSEDLDIAVKVLLKNKQFKYTDKVGVYTKAPSNWRSWFAQRKRWSIGTGLWLKDHWRNLIKYAAKYPHVAIPSILILFPTLIPIVLSYVFSNFLGYKIIDLILMLLATRFSFLIPFLFSSSLALVLLTSWVNFFISFLLFSVLFYSASRKLKLHFNFLEFLIYYFFYQPLAFFTLIVGIITPFLFSKYKLDWKV